MKVLRRNESEIVFQRNPVRTWVVTAFFGSLGLVLAIVIQAAHPDLQTADSAFVPYLAAIIWMVAMIGIALVIHIERVHLDLETRDLRISSIPTWAIVRNCGMDRAHARSTSLSIVPLDQVDTISVDTQKNNEFAAEHAFRVSVRTRSGAIIPFTSGFYPNLKEKKDMVALLREHLGSGVREKHASLDMIAVLMNEEDL